MSPTWIVNASPIIALAKIGRLDLLTEAGRELLIPSAVATEIQNFPAADPAVVAIRTSLGRYLFEEEDLNAVLEWGLGAGETAVLSAASRRKAFAIIDDREARSAAKALGVAFLGTMGVVLLARQEGRIERAADILRGLQEVGLRLDHRLISEALSRFADEVWEP